MVSFLAQAYATLVAAACLFGSSSAAPTGAADLAARKSNAAAAVQDAPHFVVYTDAWISGETGPPDVSQLNVRDLNVLYAPIRDLRSSSLRDIMPISWASGSRLALPTRLLNGR